MYAHLKELRESLGMTQGEFGKSVGIAKSTYNNYETGVRDPKSDFWVAVATKYGVTIDYLMGYSDDPHSVGTGTRKAPPISGEAMKLARDYDSLDSYGQRMLRLVADEEKARYVAQQGQQETSEPVYITRWFSYPMSAGAGIEAGDNDPEELELTKRPPRGTSYVAPVSGDSMEPTYHDGDKLFIHACKLIEVGQVGVFWMDGKQWVKEQGDGVLLSHNPAYAPIPMREDIRCQGLVLGVCDESYFE